MALRPTTRVAPCTDAHPFLAVDVQAQYMGNERTTFVIDPEGKVAERLRKVKPAGHDKQVLAALLGAGRSFRKLGLRRLKDAEVGIVARRPSGATYRVHGMRTALWLACLLVAVAGCGSSTSSQDPSTTALAQSGRALSADLDAGRYRSACNGLTLTERHMLAQEITIVATRLKGAGEAEKLAREITSIAGSPRGCVGFLTFTQTLAHATNASISFGAAFDRRLSHLLPVIQVRGDTATDHGVIEARYEGGRWRFEGQGDQPPFEVPTINSNGRRFFPPE